MKKHTNKAIYEGGIAMLSTKMLLLAAVLFIWKAIESDMGNNKVEA